ncbi:hypothetical protein Tcan_03707 [Toxocara canis]|uniref:Uncharacterized protein n=2 Tax=Toxocara canis TaxID=6265 RepID=A0A0B2VCC9_TOXCA|nr:hypothetical protein Tcan_03707 [Toxocara canis]VDM43417.1 unnamed protein product [Toxocara canis]
MENEEVFTKKHGKGKEKRSRWDSTGCESGIVMRERSEEPSESSRDNFFEHTMAPNRVLISLGEAGNRDGVEAAGGRSAAHSGTAAETGAFRPVTRTRAAQHDSEDTTVVFGRNVAFNSTSPPVSQQQQQGSVGEKRRYDNITPKLRFGNDERTQHSPIATRLRSYNSQLILASVFASAVSSANAGPEQRETLIAARRQPVKLIIHNPGGLRRASQPLAAPSTTTNKGAVFNFQPESPPYHPLKRGRLNSSGRPCLDFEKMRERMVMNSACGIGSQEFVESASIGERDIEKRRQDWALNSSTSGGRRCLQHQVLRCQQSDCAFRSPLDIDGTTSSGSPFSKDDA